MPLGIRSPRVKAARQLGKKAFRERGRSFLAEGPQAVREALRRPGVLTELFVTGQGAGRHPELVRPAAGQGIAVHEVSGEVMAELAQTITPQGLLGVCRFVDVPLAELIAGPAPRLVAVLANVRDPGNAGTVLRTADAAGRGRRDLRGRLGRPVQQQVRPLLGRQPVPPAGRGRARRWPRRSPGCGRLGCRYSPPTAARAGCVDAPGGPDLSRPTAWLFGNEAWGLPDDLLALADAVVAVPIYGRAESLNLAAAAAVCLYASARQLRT